jgi:stage II sporulation protein P
MDTISKRYVWLFFIFLIVLMLAAYIFNIVYARPEPKYFIGEPENSIAYVTVKDSEGNIIFETGEEVSVDDEYISEENKHYIVTRVIGSEGVAEIKQEVPAEKVQEINKISFNNLVPGMSIPVSKTAQAPHVAIYHTHTDESYRPTSGTNAEPGNGDIINIGKIFRDSLKLEGVNATLNDNTHDPHDINAYSRSRRTAMQLIKEEQPDAIFDLHRDSAPLSAYTTTINGVTSARIMIVVGRSNPNFKTNLAYAKRVKAAADYLYPGLVRGIFIGKGDYNQDLYPTALLFECGTSENSQERVQIAINCLTDAIIEVLLGEV